MKPILECQSLTKKYSGIFSLSNLNLTLERGQIVGLLGPNGSGKTTLINGMPLGADTKKIVSYLPERSCLNEHMRVKEILSYFSDFYENFNAAHAKAMLSDLDIDPRARLRTLSKGTREKVQLVLNALVDEIRTAKGQSVDSLFREVFKC